VTNQTVFDALLPPAFGKQKLTLKKLPLYELTEALIRIFDLRQQEGEFAYMQAFQDAVLKFATRERNDLESFLEFWDDKRNETVIKVPDDVDGAQILTIHKSKGLQFKYVIVPFCFWNMDHEFGKNPILWAKASEPPFDQAGFIPVKYSSKLEETYFVDPYTIEHTRSYLDNLNLLYVALTRAEAGLFVMAPYREKASKNPDAEIGSTASQLLYEGILQNENLRKDWDDVTKTYRVGTLVAPPEKKKPMTDAIRLTTFPSYAWSEKLVIRQSSKEFFLGADEQRSKINYGIHLHSILSRVRYAQELPAVFDALTAEGIITQDDRAGLQKQLDELLQNPEIAGWFSPEWEVRTEVPILLPGGAESRIDRLMTKNKKAIVVDFKTGEPSKADQKQVLDYIDTLRKMNFVEVDGFLLYVRTGELVSVVQKKVKTVKKKDDAQLGLGL
jgi:ATP-dependent exoDNAse (exonuclease V) beta subunit